MDVKNKALRLGATDLQRSTRKYKKYVVTYKGKKIHFGDTRYQDYTQHKDKTRRDCYRARHKKVLLSNGKPAYKDKTRPAYWSFVLLWT